MIFFAAVNVTARRLAVTTRRLEKTTQGVVITSPGLFSAGKGYKKEEDAGFRGLPPSVLAKIGIRAQRAKSGFFVLTFRRLPCPTV